MPHEFVLFPVSSVLYSGGVFSSRIIEPRYQSMVSDCVRNEKPFIAASFIPHAKNENEATFNEIGTLAIIIDFDLDDTTLLEIICRGSETVRLIHYRIQEDGLMLAQIEQRPSIINRKLPRKYIILRTILKNYIRRDGTKKYVHYLEENWENLDWLGCRLSEILPIDRQQHYELLIMEPLERLSHIKKYLKDINWL